MHFEDNFFTRMYIWEPIYISRNGIILIQSEYQSFSQNDESFHSHVELEQTWNSRRRRTELWSSCVIIFASLGTPLSLTSISVSKEILINTINFISVNICFLVFVLLKLMVLLLDVWMRLAFWPAGANFAVSSAGLATLLPLLPPANWIIEHI